MRKNRICLNAVSRKIPDSLSEDRLMFSSAGAQPISLKSFRDLWYFSKIIYFVIILLSQTVVRILSRQSFFYTVRYYFSLFYILHSTEKPVEPNFYGYLTFGHNANAILTTRVAGSFFVSQSFVFGTTKNFSMGNRISRTIRRITAFSQCRPKRFSERLPAP